LIRYEYPDRLFANREEKFRAVVAEIERLHKEGRPVLVGTTSIEDSEKLSAMLKRIGIKHEVLNAKYHEREAQIIKKAGQRGAVTISTNMAGRGTDIILGEGVAQLNGLHVIGTQRHESRRIDNQLKGRAGRQGDPGSSQFFVSLDDQLLRIFAPEWIRNMLQKQLGEGQYLESKMLSRVISKAQKKVESFHFEIRKNLLEYDNVLNEQRTYIYQLRQEILENKKIEENFLFFTANLLQKGFQIYFPKDNKAEHDPEGFLNWLSRKFGLKFHSEQKSENQQSVKGQQINRLISFLQKGDYDVIEDFQEIIKSQLNEKYTNFGKEEFSNFVRLVLLDAIDSKWKEHLYNIEVLREGIGLRGYAHLNPKLEYKKEAYELFQNMLDSISEEVATTVFNFEPLKIDEVRLATRWIIDKAIKEEFSTAKALQEWVASERKGEQINVTQAQEDEEPVIVIREEKIGRNQPCPCGSGKKYKKCCMQKQTKSVEQRSRRMSS
jgi:preprotein translocase subunit SecA